MWEGIEGEGDNKKDARDKKMYFIWLKIIATESESEVERRGEKEVKESAWMNEWGKREQTINFPHKLKPEIAGQVYEKIY